MIQRAQPSNSTATGKPAAGRETPRQAFDLLVRTAGELDQQVAQLLRPAAVTPPQYNVLRILRTAPHGLPCREISERLVRHDPDVTRLLDRLEALGFVVRSRDTEDRRVVLARITEAGNQLVDALDPAIETLHAGQFDALSARDRRMLFALLERLRFTNT